MTNKRAIALGLAAAAVTTMVAVPTFAQGDGWGKRGEGRPNAPIQALAEHREAMDAAIEADDYTAWLAAAGECPVAQEVTADEFDRLREVHRLRAEARDMMDQAREIAEEIGLESHNRGMGRNGGLMMNGSRKGFHMGQNPTAE